MRLDTYSFRIYLIDELEKSGAKILYDGGDLLLMDMHFGKRVEIHIIERPIGLDEIKHIFHKNTAEQVHTLYMLWCDLLLPENGQHFRPEPWLVALHTIHNQQVLGYKAYGDQAFIFPVSFEAHKRNEFVARYKRSIDIGNLQCFTMDVDTAELNGVWYVADFSGETTHAQHHEYRQLTDDKYNAVRAYYILLGLEKDANRDTVRQVYRQLARQFHPDLNNTQEATARMQQINEAYRLIMAQFDA